MCVCVCVCVSVWARACEMRVMMGVDVRGCMRMYVCVYSRCAFPWRMSLPRTFPVHREGSPALAADQIGFALPSRRRGEAPFPRGRGGVVARMSSCICANPRMRACVCIYVRASVYVDEPSLSLPCLVGRLRCARNGPLMHSGGWFPSTPTLPLPLACGVTSRS